MRQPSYRLVIALPVAGYLVAMLCVAVFVVKPPALGWIGFAVAAAVGVLVSALAVRLFPWTRTSGDAERPAIGDRLRLLVVVDADCAGETLCEAVLDRAIDSDAEVLVVAPVLASPLHFVTEAEAADRDAAGERLHRMLDALEARGIRARGEVGTDDPLTAIGDALSRFAAAEILLVAAGESRRSWLEHGLERAVRETYGVPVTTFASESPRDAAFHG